MMLDTLIATLQEKRADLGNVNVRIEFDVKSLGDPSKMVTVDATLSRIDTIVRGENEPNTLSIVAVP